MTRYLLYSNPSHECHVFERIDGDKVSRLVSDPNEPEWNLQLSTAHALFRIAEMVCDKEALTKMKGDLDLLFERCEENEDKEN